MRRRLRIVSLLAALLLATYAVSYLAFRARHVQRSVTGEGFEVIFPENSRGLYLFYRPAAWIDHAATGMNFHIGPHR